MSDDTTPFAWPVAEADYRRGLEVELHAMETQGKTDRADQIRAAIAALPVAVADPPAGDDDATIPGAGTGDGGTLTADALEGLDVDELRAAGEAAGLDVDRRLGADKLREDLARQLADKGI